jgi:ABC-type Mn2+/Zn2+ transport system ATPase subunit
MQPRFPYRCHHRCEQPVNGLAVHIEDLQFCYPQQDRSSLDIPQLAVKQGQIVALSGPNGSGKSTFFKILAGMLQPQRGVVTLFGNPVGSCHHCLAYLPQRPELLWSFPMTVEEMVMTGRYVHLGWFRQPGTTDHAIVQQAMERMCLMTLRHRQIGSLSGGQQQRVLLARALVQEASLLLLDEPSSGLDRASQSELQRLLRSLVEEGKTIIEVTHHCLEHQHPYDEIISLMDGRLRSSSSTIAVTRKHREPCTF